MENTRHDLQSRVEDYLNDKFQNVADLQSVDNLLAKLQEQQALLKSQLEDAKKDQKVAEDQFQQAKTALRDRAVQHENEQADIERRLVALTHSEVSDDALRVLEEPMQKLRRIDLAENYIQTLRNVDDLEKQAKEQLQSAPERAIEAHRTLQRIATDIEASQVAAEGAAPLLFDQIRERTKVVHDLIEHDLEERLSIVLGKMKWPKKDLSLATPFVEEWSKTADLLLDLQEPILLKEHPDLTSQTPQDSLILLPLAVMVRPLEQRFRFHFYGDKSTNRLDKPQYFFSHILDLIDQQNVFFTTFFQPLLDTRIRKDDRLDLVYTDAVSSYISALLPMLLAKCLSLLPQLKGQPQLMSHFVREVMMFDSTLRQTWAYAPVPGPLSDWKGLTWDILTKHSYFDTWLRLEKDFAISRYQEILDDPKSRAIDYDGVERNRTKPTSGAIRVNDILENTTDRYRQLLSFSQKMRFLMDIQLAIFDRYHNYLFDHLKTYQTNSHTVGRAVTGQVASEAMGITGLETLTKIFGSAEYLERKMTDWSDDVFFLELWEELQDRASQNTRNDGTVGRGLSVEDVASRTSSTIRNADEILESEGGALFDETASSYRRLRSESEAEIVRLLQVNTRNSIRAIQGVSIWASLSSTVSDFTQLAPSSALDNFTQVMVPLLEVLAKTLAPTPLRRLVRQIGLTIQEELLDRLVLRHSFSAAGASQLKRDIAAISTTINAGIGMQGEIEKYLGRLNAAAYILSLPIKSTKPDNAGGDEDGWGFDDDEEIDAEEVLDVGEENDWGLWQAEKALFADNTSARKALKSMGLQQLTESDARNIIKRRIELNS